MLIIEKYVFEKRRYYQKCYVIFSLFLASIIKLIFVEKVIYPESHGLNSNLSSKGQKFPYLREKCSKPDILANVYQTFSLTSRSWTNLSFNRCNRIPSSLQVDCSELGCSRKRHSHTDRLWKIRAQVRGIARPLRG